MSRQESRSRAAGRGVADLALVLLLAALVGGQQSTAQVKRGGAAVRRNLVLEVQPAPAPEVVLDWSWQSPNLLPALEADGASLDHLLDQSGRTLDRFVESSGARVEDVVRGLDEPADFILQSAGRSRKTLLEVLGRETDWVLLQAGADRAWLVTRAGVSADQLLRRADRDLAWLLARMGKTPAWILSESGHGIPWMIERAGHGTDWVQAQVTELLCGELDGRAGAACAKAVSAVAGGLSGLVEKSGRGAQWWLSRSGRDVNWLIAVVGYTADDLLARAGHGLPWLISQLDLSSEALLALSGHNLDWLLDQLGRGSGWLLERAGRDEEWLLRRLGHDLTWLLQQMGKDARWLLGRLGRSPFEGHLEAMLGLTVRLPAGGFIRQRFPGQAWLQPFGPPGQGPHPRWTRAFGLRAGRVELRQRAAVERAQVEFAYRDRRGAAARRAGVASPVAFDPTITLGEERRLHGNRRLAAPLTVDLCVPSMAILSGLAKRLPGADRARLELFPDLRLRLQLVLGVAFRPERVVPGTEFSELLERRPGQSTTTVAIDYQSTAITQLALERAEWAFAGENGCGAQARLRRRHQIDLRGTKIPAGTQELKGRVVVELPFSAEATGAAPARPVQDRRPAKAPAAAPPKPVRPPGAGTS